MLSGPSRLSRMRLMMRDEARLLRSMRLVCSVTRLRRSASVSGLETSMAAIRSRRVASTVSRRAIAGNSSAALERRYRYSRKSSCRKRSLRVTSTSSEILALSASSAGPTLSSWLRSTGIVSARRSASTTRLSSACASACNWNGRVLSATYGAMAAMAAIRCDSSSERETSGRTCDWKSRSASRVSRMPSQPTSASAIAEAKITAKARSRRERTLVGQKRASAGRSYIARSTLAYWTRVGCVQNW